VNTEKETTLKNIVALFKQLSSPKKLFKTENEKANNHKKLKTI